MERPENVQTLFNGKDPRHTGKAGRDVITLGVALASITMFVGTGGAIMPAIIRSLSGMGVGPDRLLVTTVLLTVLAMPLAMLIGLLVALGRLYGPRWLAVPLEVYVEVIRGTPVLFQLMVLFFFLPTVGIRLEAFWAGLIGLAMNYGAYEAENYRAGIQSILRSN